MKVFSFFFHWIHSLVEHLRWYNGHGTCRNRLTALISVDLQFYSLLIVPRFSVEKNNCAPALIFSFFVLWRFSFLIFPLLNWCASWSWTRAGLLASRQQVGSFEVVCGCWVVSLPGDILIELGQSGKHISKQLWTSR